MKDSGIDWIGKIPEEWIVSKAKTILHNKTVKNHPNAEVLSLYRDLGVVPKNSRDDNHNVTSEDTSSYKFVQKGELVLNKMKTWQGSLAVSNYEGIVSPAYYVCEFTNNEIDKNYIHYLLRNKMYAQEFERLSTGLRVGQWDLSIDDFLNTLIIYPPTKSEQTKIANFLDKKCAQIDSIIEESKKSIEEYKSWKQSVIFEAVTGKNLSCKKKDSGIEWLGEIPENFIITRIKHIATLAGRIGWQGLTSQEYSDEGCYLITGINFSNGEINWESCVRVPYSRWEEASQIQIENGDLLITKDGTVGKVAIVNNMPDKTSLNSGVLLIRQNKKLCSTRFLFWILQSNVFWKWFNYINAGNSTIIHLYQHDFSNFSFPNPSIEIQNEISNYLDKRCAQIDSLISEKQSLIKDLAEYKKSLIFEAVTGKRRV